jgi:AcrR family transcriptional regulator
MSKRAEDVEATRERIIAAAARLHGTIGPAATTVSALAEEAGVTRLTVYRHFPDDLSLFTACSAHWMSSQPVPNPDSWAANTDPAERIRAGLADVYRFYRSGEAMLTNVRRDRAAVPEPVRARAEAANERYRAVLLEPFDGTEDRMRLAHALLGHALAFETWRSLCVDQGLSDRAANEAMTGLVMAAMR